MADLFEVVNESSKHSSPVNIKVIGVGGCGGNTVEHICKSSEIEVDFLCANTDVQAMENVNPGNNSLDFIQLGKELTGGKGAGAKPEIGKNAALEDEKEIESALQGTDMLFITAGMGGGTGTGASPVIAAIAKRLEILTLAVVTTPFEFEGGIKAKAAEEGIKNLKDNVDSLIVVPNEKLFEIMSDDADMDDAYAMSDDVLAGAVRGVAHIITRPGKRNIDFADVQTVMSDSGGLARMGVGRASGESRAEKAMRAALNNPLLTDLDFKQARGVLVNMCTSADRKVNMKEFKIISDLVKDFAAKDAMVIYGDTYDANLGEELMITMVATGFGENRNSKVINNKDAFNGNRLNTVSRVETLQSPTRRVGSVREVQDYKATKLANNERTASSMMRTTEEIYDVPAFVRKQAD